MCYGEAVVTRLRWMDRMVRDSLSEQTTASVREWHGQGKGSGWFPKV